MAEKNFEKLEWSELEYQEKERSVDWFWALGVIVIAGSIASILFGNYFFAILLIISGILLGFFAIKKPDMVPYELNEKGFKIKTRLYPYEDIKSFCVQIEIPGKEIKKPTLFIRSSRVLLPILSIPIEERFAEKIRNIMLSKNISEEKMAEHPSDKIMDSLGF
ncbi:MAG: hypothetical protein ABH951_03070 [Patescibacteria group bacterium]